MTAVEVLVRIEDDAGEPSLVVVLLEELSTGAWGASLAAVRH